MGCQNRERRPALNMTIEQPELCILYNWLPELLPYERADTEELNPSA